MICSLCAQIYYNTPTEPSYQSPYHIHSERMMTASLDADFGISFSKEMIYHTNYIAKKLI